MASPGHELLQATDREAVGRVAGGIVHELNNLMTTVSGFTELVLATLDDTDERRADLLEVRQAAERAARLTEELLTVGRQDASRT